MSDAAPFLNLDVVEAQRQWSAILRRETKPKGTRQENFRPVEVISALALLFVVDPSTQGWGTFDPLVESLARIAKRPPSSFVEKERNLTGARPNSGKGEQALFRAVVGHPGLAFELWAIVMDGARRAGIGPELLPDLLDVSSTSGLLGQEELDDELRDLVADERGRYEASGLDPETSERAAMSMARIGQHRFAATVRSNYDHRCGFCGLDTAGLQNQRLLLASHVKPWRDGTTKERLDPRNGVAACPTHDAAFDGGLLTVTADGRIHRARLLRDASERDRVAHTMFTTSVVERLLVDESHLPRGDYLEWHQERIWKNGVGALEERA